MKYQPPQLAERFSSCMVGEVPIAPFDAGAARVYGLVRLASRERRRDALDTLIAAHALALDLILVTNNPRDFAARLRQARGLWAERSDLPELSVLHGEMDRLTVDQRP
jgi:predicted nucleic acid-binding protein